MRNLCKFSAIRGIRTFKKGGGDLWAREGMEMSGSGDRGSALGLAWDEWASI